MSGAFNPYQPPSAEPNELRESPATIGLASRGERFGAALIDALIGLALALPLQIAFGVYDGFPNVRMNYKQNAIWGAVGLVFYVAVHGYFLAKYAQTVGKKLLRIQIVNYADGAQTPAGKILLARVLPVSLLVQIPAVGPFLSVLDSCFIFGQSRRCLHDFIAGTKVVKLTPARP